MKGANLVSACPSPGLPDEGEGVVAELDRGQHVAAGREKRIPYQLSRRADRQVGRHLSRRDLDATCLITKVVAK